MTFVATAIGLIAVLVNDRFSQWNKGKHRDEKNSNVDFKQRLDNYIKRKKIFDRCIYYPLVIAAILSLIAAYKDKQELDGVINKLNNVSSAFSGLNNKIQAYDNQIQKNQTDILKIANQLQQVELKLTQVQQTATKPNKTYSKEDNNNSSIGNLKPKKRNKRGCNK